MDLQEKLELLEEIMDMDEGTLAQDAQLDEVEEWDSLSKLGLMAEIKKRMNKRISIEEILGFHTVQDILNYLE